MKIKYILLAMTFLNCGLSVSQINYLTSHIQIPLSQQEESEIRNKFSITLYSDQQLLNDINRKYSVIGRFKNEPDENKLRYVINHYEQLKNHKEFIFTNDQQISQIERSKLFLVSLDLNEKQKKLVMDFVLQKNELDQDDTEFLFSLWMQSSIEEKKVYLEKIKEKIQNINEVSDYLVKCFHATSHEFKLQTLELIQKEGLIRENDESLYLMRFYTKEEKQIASDIINEFKCTQKK